MSATSTHIEPNGNHPHAAQTPRSVLIVDDDPSVLNVAHAVLGQSGYTCVKTRSALKALAALGTQRFDLMIADISMNGMSGLELARQALSRINDLSVIIMSDKREVETPVLAMRAGTTDYLIKPFDQDELLDCVARALARKETQFERYQRRDQLTGWDAAARAFSLSLNARDKETEGHAERVVEYSQRLGREVGLTKEQLVALELGARLHDIGKIGVPDAVLKKPHPLTDEEWEIMKLHPARGEQMVRMMKLPEAAALIVGQHHEKWNGSGYPNQLKGEQIHIGARVFSVVDAYDAITSDRVYRLGRPYETAVEEILAYSGTQFDPRVVEAFARIPKHDWLEITQRYPWEQVNSLNLAVA